MSTTFQPPPTYADVIVSDPATDKPVFNPVWLKWFLDVAALLGSVGGGGGAVDHNLLSSLQGGTASEYYHLTSARYSTLVGNQNVNLVFAGPGSGAPAPATFRALVAADISGIAGTVTSVAIAATPTGIFDITGSPITTAGTITISMDNQAANLVLAGPESGAATTPAFRSLITTDIPVVIRSASLYYAHATFGGF